MISTNRGVIKYILLTILTLGIYAFWYQYKIAKDINTICAGDGKHTGGLLKFMFLGVLTLGIYIFVWYFKTANRLAENAERYGVEVPANGVIVILWKLFGFLLFGIGSLIADHIIMKSTNILAEAYNKKR